MLDTYHRVPDQNNSLGNNSLQSSIQLPKISWRYFFSHNCVIFVEHNKDSEREVSKMMILLLVLVVAVLYFNKGGKYSHSHNQNNKSADDLLKERFVNGEIDETTYLTMKQIIGK